MTIEELKAENARLKEQHDFYKSKWEKKNNDLFRIINLEQENARLKSEVERLDKFNDEASAYIEKEQRKMDERYEMMQEDIDKLIKAGDDVVAHIGNDEASQDKCADIWRAVKKGVQS